MFKVIGVIVVIAAIVLVYTFTDKEKAEHSRYIKEKEVAALNAIKEKAAEALVGAKKGAEKAKEQVVAAKDAAVEKGAEVLED